MTIVLGTALICSAAMIFTILAVLCRAPAPPALLRKDLTQTLCLLGLMAMVAVGAGVLAAGFNAAYAALDLIVAGLVAAGSVAAITVLIQRSRPAGAAENGGTGAQISTGARKVA